MGEAWHQEVLDFWFGLDPRQHWTKSDDFDAEVTASFGALWEEQAAREARDFLGSADEALAAIILFDQFPRNMFRGHARSFSTDHLARAIAGAAVDRGYDAAVAAARRGFFYMPFEHAERIADQQRSVALFTALGDPELIRYARLHHDVIARFGRFPHRNAILGRSPRADELAATDVPSF